MEHIDRTEHDGEYLDRHDEERTHDGESREIPVDRPPARGLPDWWDRDDRHSDR